ncbi:hypothetical protein BJ138DRAFT_1008139, partial [Hygrophoropsis aurantiaca]
SLKWTRNQLFLKSRMLNQRRRVNPWNAFLKSKLSEENRGRSPGTRVKLTQFVAENKTALLQAYKKLTPAEKSVLETDVLTARQASTKTARANPKALLHDFNANFAAMDREVSCKPFIWKALCARTGVEGFYVAVRGSVEDFGEPKMFFTSKADNFARTVLDIEPRKLALKLESWVVSDLGPTQTRQRPLNKLISACRTHIQDELEFILVEKKIFGTHKMNYENYERAVVERFGVALVGWPSGRVRNPARMGGKNEVQALYDALTNETCRWVSLTPSQLDDRIASNNLKARAAHGEVVYKPRKKRGGAGSSDKHKSAATVPTDSGSSDSDSD